MSGIAGIIQLDSRPVDRADLYRMSGLLARRGPDGGGVWHEGRVGLVHRLLCTTPESLHEQQRLHHRHHTCVLTADARLDNRDELLRVLNRQGRPPNEVTDADLILAAYERWGEDGPKHLLGAFAFALWDGPNRRLFCARDHIGVRPFYYAHRPGRLFAFGSEVKALLSLEDVPAEINETRIADYLAHLGEDPEITFYQHVRRLPPAHTLTLTEDGTVRLRRYWELDAHHEVRYASDAEYEEHFRAIFTEAVRCRLRTHGVPSVMVSGGLDSSSVACVARDQLTASGRGPLQAFTGIFPSLPEAERRRSDERAYIEALQAQGGLEVHAIRLDELGPLKDIDAVVGYLDAPPFICNMYLQTAMHLAVREKGVRVILDGGEGDDAVSHGFGYLGELLYDGHWAQSMEEVAQLAARSGVSPTRILYGHGRQALRLRARQHLWRFVFRDVLMLRRHLGLSPRFLLREYAVKPRVPDAVRLGWRSLRGRMQKPAEWKLLSDALIERTSLYERYRWLKAPYDVEKVREQYGHWLSLHAGAGLTSAALAEINHLAAMHGVERRHPFYDIRLLQYCVALPPDQKLRGGWTRSILRRAMDGMLPASIQWRPGKADLSPNFIRNLFQYDAHHVDALFKEDQDRIAPYVDLEVLQRARQRRDAVTLWHAATLAHWLRRIEGPAVSPLSQELELQAVAVA